MQQVPSDPSALRSLLASLGYVVEEFSPSEEELLLRHFTNVDLPVFALKGLPEVVRGALFARYSRSAKSLRRLFLDEFASDVASASDPLDASAPSATALYERVLGEYGDDSVAQLGGAHVACEQVSNVLTKLLERPRLASYLEQSTRYVPYDARVSAADGSERFRYHLDQNLRSSALGERCVTTCDSLFETYSELLLGMFDHFAALHPRSESDPERVWRSAVRAKALDSVRGLLPAATRSNVGIYASGQAYEALVLRLRASALPEARLYGELLLRELRAVIPSFLARVDRPERGGVWVDYLASTRVATSAVASRLTSDLVGGSSDEVSLVSFDPDGEDRVLAAILAGATSLPESVLADRVRSLPAVDRSELLGTYVGDRTNRRHRPGRAFEATSYRFEVLSDYGAFRDLQRHRLCTLEWQPLGPDHGYVLPEAVVDAGFEGKFTAAMDAARSLHEDLVSAGYGAQASYVVPLAYRIRFTMDMNAREAMHVLELRTQPAGHPSYRRVCQRMHDLVGGVHPHLAAAMSFVDHSEVELERLEGERRTEERRRRLGV